MIHLGVEVRTKSFKIVALSKSFTPLGQEAFPKYRTKSIKNWLLTFAGYSEQSRSFGIFDDSYQPPIALIEQFEPFAEFYTVNHRMVCEVLNTFHEYSLMVTGRAQCMGKAFFPETLCFGACPECSGTRSSVVKAAVSQAVDTTL